MVRTVTTLSNAPKNFASNATKSAIKQLNASHKILICVTNVVWLVIHKPDVLKFGTSTPTVMVSEVDFKLNLTLLWYVLSVEFKVISDVLHSDDLLKSRSTLQYKQILTASLRTTKQKMTFLA